MFNSYFALRGIVRVRFVFGGVELGSSVECRVSRELISMMFFLTFREQCYILLIFFFVQQ